MRKKGADWFAKKFERLPWSMKVRYSIWKQAFKLLFSTHIRDGVDWYKLDFQTFNGTLKADLFIIDHWKADDEGWATQRRINYCVSRIPYKGLMKEETDL
jgi:hypothetical protein